MKRRITRLAAAFMLASITGVAGADGMGGFDQPYSNAGNTFGHGAWGNGSGTALPVPSSGSNNGPSFETPYQSGVGLFGTGFW
jgi:hypothetical protein